MDPTSTHCTNYSHRILLKGERGLYPQEILIDVLFEKETRKPKTLRIRMPSRDPISLPIPPIE